MVEDGSHNLLLDIDPRLLEWQVITALELHAESVE
jgi:hypothetical protein